MPTQPQPMPAQHEFSSEPGPTTKTKSRRGVWLVAMLCVLAVAVVAWQRWQHPAPAGNPQGSNNALGGKGRGGPQQGKPPSVRVIELQPRPFEIVLEGLGTVTPIATVTVRSQVDGPLLSVAFQEGAAVKRGELLAQVDPRPFRIKLAQAKAATQRDQATLQNAKLDLERYKSLSEQKLWDPLESTCRHASLSIL